MKKKVMNFYRWDNDCFEHCFNVEVSEELNPKELEILTWLLAETFEPQNFRLKPSDELNVVEVGPLLTVATPWNTNALSICHACGLTKITKIEKSKRTQFSTKEEAEAAKPKLFDRMTQMIYPEPLKSFDTGRQPEAVYTIPMTAEGPNSLLKIPGLSMDAADRDFYYHYFVELEHRDPTIVEILDLNNANSEHCRHGYFKGQQIIDGVEMSETLMEIVKSTLTSNPQGSILAFRDNSSGIEGYHVNTLLPKHPGQRSVMELQERLYNLIFTAETHNFPTTISPYAGAETGTGGRIRDIQATGRGGLTIAGTTGYFVGNLYIPGYKLPWEKEGWIYPKNIASPLKIMIEGSNGASDYGNKFGEPVITGTAASVGIELPDGERQEYLKAILFTGGIGMLDDEHIEKGEAEPGMLIVQVGGPAYRIGFGGGSASSLNQGDQAENLDFNAVQRGDGEMGQKVNRVIRACVEMGDDNPIVIVHDQGAGGPANVLKELVEKYGGRIDVRKITLGDPTLSVLETWICEFQERNGFIISPERIEEFQRICKREKVNCEVLGEVTDDGYFVVYDSADDSIPVRLDLSKVLGGLPQKTFRDQHLERKLLPLELPNDFSLEEGIKRIFGLVSVGSKDHLTAKVDRSVTGLIAQQQCCGAVQIPVSDFGVVAQSHFPDDCDEYTGAVTAIGEKHMEMILDTPAAARMTVAEMLTNMAPALISDLHDLKVSANWMWAPKLPGEGARLYDAATALRDFMVKVGIAIDGGKDSLSMVTKIQHPEGRTELVKSPSQLVLSGYVTMGDIRQKVTPDLKYPGKSALLRVDLAHGERRLGGSALAQVYGQVGDNYPDIDARTLVVGFNAIQELVRDGLISACHDISKGGLITTLLEMAFAGNCGLNINYDTTVPLTAELFAEEAGWVIECLSDNMEEVIEVLKEASVPYQKLGCSLHLREIIITKNHSEIVFSDKLGNLKEQWHETSYQLEKLQILPGLAKEKKMNICYRPGANYDLSFKPKATQALFHAEKPEVAIIREEGSNGDREMSSAFYQAGFKVFDITMSDLLKGTADLDDFQMAVFVGGFSYADVLDSAKGWAGTVKFNERLKQMFEDFFKRPDTLSLGICNGCQFLALTGLLFPELKDEEQPRFIANDSGRFESHFLTVKIMESQAVMLQDMEGSTLGVWSAHGEGKAFFPNNKTAASMSIPIRYVKDNGSFAKREDYPFNPNGSPDGIAGLCSADGRHLIMMPHPERTFLPWQWAYWPKDWADMEASPWLKMFQNARDWCVENK
ncbi:MAG: phosphoribosylformylglycinamidine synthase [Candidatus Falkowbacteria bacterium]|nr:MAG: phosphoribosylformylglycinamidine synthase [Candidatus Falkowbacteria bacterium]